MHADLLRVAWSKTLDDFLLATSRNPSGTLNKISNERASAVALAALASTAAFAQSSVTISGGIDAGIGRSTTNNTDTSVTSVAIPRNNITFSGTEDLGGGLKASFGLQHRFNPASGANPYAALFEQAYASVSGGFGTVKAGRFTGVFAGASGATDPWGTDSSGIAPKSTFATARYDGQVAYSSPSFNGVTVSAQINPQANQAVAATNVQDGKELAVAYAAGAAYANVATREDNNKDKYVSVNGSYDLGVAKLFAGYAKKDVFGSTADIKSTLIGVSMPMGATVVSAGYRKITIAGGTPDESRFALRAQYNLSKRTAVVGDVYKDSQTGTTFQTGYYAGLRHTF